MAFPHIMKNIHILKLAKCFGLARTGTYLKLFQFPICLIVKANC